jgi:shikimate kinase
MGLNVFLDIGVEEAWRRVVRTGLPSFLTSSDPESEFAALYRERRPLYQRQADITLHLNDLAPEQALESLIAALEERRHARK